MSFKVEVQDRYGIIAIHTVEAPTVWQARDIEEAKGYKVLSVSH